jgi:hypothetical protein
MTKAVHLHVGDSHHAIGKRVADAWHRAERGVLTSEKAEIHIGFENWETMVRTLSSRRLKLRGMGADTLRAASARSPSRSPATTAASKRMSRFWPQSALSTATPPASARSTMHSMSRCGWRCERKAAADPVLLRVNSKVLQ